MPVTLDTTVGGPTANSYASEAEFTAYASTRLPAIAWAQTATSGQIDVALINAARVMDRAFQWTGAVVDDVQAMQWPRNGMLDRGGFVIPSNVNPDDLKSAQIELALQMGNGDLMSDSDAAKNNVSSVRAGSVGVSFQQVVTSTREAVDLLIRRQDSELLYVSNLIPTAVRMLLVPSWYKHNTATRPVIFKSVGL